MTASLVAVACGAGDDDFLDNADAGPDGASDADIDADTDALGPWPDEKYLTVHEVHERLVAGDPAMLLLYVIDEQFYNLGMIEGSLVIPWDILPDNTAAVDPDRHLVIYCRHGIRSEGAYSTLIGSGFELVWIMDGGIVAWANAGYPVVPVP